MDNSILPVNTISYISQLVQENVRTVSNTYVKDNGTEISKIEHTLELYDAGGKLYTVYRTNSIDYMI